MTGTVPFFAQRKRRTVPSCGGLFQSQLAQLSRQRVAAPADQFRRLLAPALHACERGPRERPLESRARDFEQRRAAGRQVPRRPGLELTAPPVGRLENDVPAAFSLASHGKPFAVGVSTGTVW